MQRFINNWTAVLQAPLGSGDAAVHVSSALAGQLVGLGGGDFYLLTVAQLNGAGQEVGWEIVKATSVTGGAITIQRAQEGTTPLSLPVGAPVSARLTAGALNALAAANSQLQTEVSALTARVEVLETGGEVPGNALANQAGEVLVNQAGEILTMGVMG